MWLDHVSDKILILSFFIPVDDEQSIIAIRFYSKITGIRAIDKAIAWLGSKANRIVERQGEYEKKTFLRDFTVYICCFQKKMYCHTICKEPA